MFISPAAFVQALASSLRLGGEPAPADAAAADAVFGRLMALHKGRALLARTLHALDAPLCTLEPPSDPDPDPSEGAEGQPDGMLARAPDSTSKPSPLRPLWAVLRNARALFGAGVRAGARAGAGPGGSVGGPEAMADATVTELGATAQLARAASKVTQNADSALGCCACLPFFCNAPFVDVLQGVGIRRFLYDARL